MKYFILLTLFILAGCSTARVIVRDCQDLKGSDQKNCEYMRKL